MLASRTVGLDPGKRNLATITDNCGVTFEIHVETTQLREQAHSISQSVKEGEESSRNYCAGDEAV